MDKAAYEAQKAIRNYRIRAKEAAEACLVNPKSTFAERNRANIVLKKLRKGQDIK